MPISPAILRPRVFAQVAAAPGILPSDIAGLVAWFKADAGTFQQSDGTVAAAADGDVVGYWADQSGNNYHATQATTDNKPILKTGANGINSRAVVRGDGTNDKLATASITHGIGTGDFWWLVVVRPLNEHNWDTLASNGSFAPAMYPRILPATYWGIFWGAGVSFDQVTTLQPNTAYVLEWGRASGTLYGYTNGTVGSNAPANATSMANAALSLFDSGAAEYGNMDIAEFMIYSNKPSDANLTALRAYLNNRWAVY